MIPEAIILLLTQALKTFDGLPDDSKSLIVKDIMEDKAAWNKRLERLENLLGGVKDETKG